MFGRTFEVTNVKDMRMISCWDDRAVEIIANEGVVAHEVAYQKGLREGVAGAPKDVADTLFMDMASEYENLYPLRRTSPEVDDALTKMQIALDKFGQHNTAKYGFGKGRMP